MAWSKDYHFIAFEDLPVYLSWITREGKELRTDVLNFKDDYEFIEQQLRMRLWLGHGHTGQYGDDGEMQCGECRIWDYKRTPIRELIEQVDRLKLEKLKEQMTKEPRQSNSLIQQLEERDTEVGRLQAISTPPSQKSVLMELSKYIDERHKAVMTYIEGLIHDKT